MPADTAEVLSVPEPVPDEPAAPAVRLQPTRPEASSAKEVAVDTALIDDLFRQATDLFD